jgi:hypothetical protein
VSWEDYWHDLTASLAKLELLSVTGTHGGPANARNTITNFFSCSIALGEAAAQAQGVSLTQLKKKVEALPEPWIAICRDLAIERKHTVRTGGDWAGDPHLTLGDPTEFHYYKSMRQSGAYVPTPGVSPTPTRCIDRTVYNWTFAYTPSSTGVNQTIDGITLARQTVQQWISFLPTLGLTLPPSI